MSIHVVGVQTDSAIYVNCNLSLEKVKQLMFFFIFLDFTQYRVLLESLSGRIKVVAI